MASSMSLANIWSNMGIAPGNSVLRGVQQRSVTDELGNVLPGAVPGVVDPTGANDPAYQQKLANWQASNDLLQSMYSSPPAGIPGSVTQSKVNRATDQISAAASDQQRMLAQKAAASGFSAGGGAAQRALRSLSSDASGRRATTAAGIRTADDQFNAEQTGKYKMMAGSALADSLLKKPIYTSDPYGGAGGGGGRGTGGGAQGGSDISAQGLQVMMGLKPQVVGHGSGMYSDTATAGATKRITTGTNLGRNQFV